jgi:hypothetical protein
MSDASVKPYLVQAALHPTAAAHRLQAKAVALKNKNSVCPKACNWMIPQNNAPMGK